MDSAWSLHDQEITSHGSQTHGEPSGEDESLPDFSDYGDSMESSGFTSIASHVLRHAHQEGRRYQSFRLGSYPLPNDSIEQEREEMKHLMVKRLFDGHDFLAPMGKNPQKIIDVGTGLGLWAIDVADKFPGAQVVGVDITPIQSPVIPHNVIWRIDDIESTEWAPSYSAADFIHMRSVISILPRHEEVIESAFRNLKSGGWVEFQELWCDVGCDDGTMRADHPMLRFSSLLRQHFAPLHQWNIDLAQELPTLLQQVGFINVNIHRYKIPIGAWARDQKRRELGLFMSKHVVWQFVEAVLVKWSDMGLASRTEADILQADVRRAFDDPEIHAYLPWISVWAQKP
ncbi:S-adenosyl-L-methionine-dependent methyltransferase [Plectosphaerella plurivora]|uniref:S-adenosyl-L-methionine-dependent methyltransferase n=1 Tax=Plectosphaerella plurivora TaxID=936078 RepID=A0A9P8VFT7_9PEZI|nr:S-adenosyl-L-methionine-dependent methyltransferase [Plectosphaerella plurivora]